MNKENKEKLELNICSSNGCGRLTYKKSKYCIFHAKLKEKNKEDFKEALEKYIEKIKEKGIIYDFMGFIFIGNINFREDYKVEFFNNIVRFDSAIFHGETSFSGITFNNYAFFTKTKFYKSAYFIGVNFQNDAIFNGANFDKVHFNATNFSGNANFNETSFKLAFFPLVKFNGTTEFGNLYKLERMHFNKTRFLSGVSVLFWFNVGKATFNNTLLENISLSFKLGKDATINFKNTRLNNTNIKRRDLEGHIIQENERDFIQAKEIFLLIKNNFHSIGRYEDESWAFKKEKDMERKDNCHFKSLHKWLWSCVLNGIFGYGEQPVKVIISAMSIILIFAFLFMSFGISNVDIERITTKNFFDCIYFSTVTFTTLGYGDFRPLEGWGRILAGTEAFIGAFMMALFVYTFARKTGGR